jgi:regulator of replication initiation timing
MKPARRVRLVLLVAITIVLCCLVFDPTLAQPINPPSPKSLPSIPGVTSTTVAQITPGSAPTMSTMNVWLPALIAALAAVVPSIFLFMTNRGKNTIDVNNQIVTGFETVVRTVSDDYTRIKTQLDRVHTENEALERDLSTLRQDRNTLIREIMTLRREVINLRQNTSLLIELLQHHGVTVPTIASFVSQDLFEKDSHRQQTETPPIPEIPE